MTKPSRNHLIGENTRKIPVNCIDMHELSEGKQDIFHILFIISIAHLNVLMQFPINQNIKISNLLLKKVQENS